MRKSFIKILAIALIVGLNWTGLSAIMETFAYFNDTAVIQGSTYTAGTLNLSLRSDQSNFVPNAGSMKPGDQANRDIYVGKTTSSLALKHNVSFEFTGGDANLCAQLDLKIWYDHYNGPVSGGYANRDMRLTYNGKLSALTNYRTSDFEIPHTDDQFDTDPSDGTEQWFYYSVNVPQGLDNSYQNKSCQFKFIFTGWQNNFSDPSQGFTDTKEITNTIALTSWTPDVKVTYPNGKEEWYLVPGGSDWTSWCSAHGMNANCEYAITWTATNKIGLDTDLLINIYFSSDSGHTWVPIVTNTENDGLYLWKIPYDASYITGKARIKVEATPKDYPLFTNWDMSDADFCPPMMTLDDLLNWEKFTEEEQIVTTTTTTVPEAETSTKEPTTTTTTTTIPEDVTTTTTTIPVETTTTTTTTTTIPVETTTTTTTTIPISTPTTTTTTEPPISKKTVIEGAPTPEIITPVIDETPANKNSPIIKSQPTVVAPLILKSDGANNNNNDSNASTPTSSIDNSGSISTGDNETT